MLAVLLVIYTLLFSALIYTGRSEKYAKYRVYVKTLTSCFFIITALYSAFSTNHTEIIAQLLPAFILCAIGDFLLGLSSKNKLYTSNSFLYGLISFLFAHIAFYLALCRIQNIMVMDFVIPIILMVFTYFMSKTNYIKLENMRIPAIVYSFFVALLFSKGLMLLVYGGATNKNLFFFFGSLLFLISDTIILFLNFYVKPLKFLEFYNLLTYYLGMILLACSNLF